MNNTIQSQLDRIEAALTTLTDSIASYNPSVAAVHDLLAADDALTEGLNQLSTHQLNHHRILALHATSTALTTSLTTTLRTLSALRTSILSAPATLTTPSHRPVPASTLLDYAKNISTYGAPPGLREKLAAVKQEALAKHASIEPATQPNSTQEPSTQQPFTQVPHSPALPNGTTTPFHPAPAPAPPTPTTATNGIAISSLSAPEVHWLNPLLHTPYLAWPSEEKIRQGALASLQARWESGEGVEHREDKAENKGDGEGTEGEGAGAGITGAGGRGGKESGGDGMDGMEGVAGSGERGRNGVRGQGRGLENGVKATEAKPSVFQGLDMYDMEDE